jgi:hypothetical protein
MTGQTAGQRSYKVAIFNLRLQTNNLFIVFKEGWHPTETAEEGAVEWQWSKKEATLAFRNPRRDALFYLQLDQPVKGLPEPQRVELHLGDALVDSFTLHPQETELRRIALSADQFGNAETAELRLTVDRTFVPAAVPGLGNSDPRELGVRVFRAFLQPR